MHITTYLAGPIESDAHASDWRSELKTLLAEYPILIYDPVHLERVKTGYNYKQAGQALIKHIKEKEFDKFIDICNKIWWGNLDIRSSDNVISVLQTLRNRKIVDRNTQTDMPYWGDLEAVVRSDFIVMYLKKNVRTVGTFIELAIAWLFKIPVFTIIEEPMHKMSFSALYFILMSGGTVFSSVKDCASFIKSNFFPDVSSR